MFVFGGYSVKQKIPLADFHALDLSIMTFSVFFSDENRDVNMEKN